MKKRSILVALLSLVLAADCTWSAWSTITGSPVLDERVDQSIEKALIYMVANQKVDGAFDENPAITGLCGMSFLAKGYLPGPGKYGGNIERAIDYVMSKVENNGFFGGSMYVQGICTLFLSEVSGMVDPVRQAKIDEILPKAVQVILSSQGDDGGWTYPPSKGSHDFSISGWQLMALRAARLNGAPVPKKAIDDAVKYALNHHDPEQGTFGYSGRSDNSVTLSGAGILCLELCGQHGNPAIARAGRYLMNVYEQLPSQGHCFYGLYYTAQGLFQIGGTEWRRFSKWMYEYWIPRQKADGAFGDMYSTAMTALAFAVPYRQLPIYQRDETVDAE